MNTPECEHCYEEDAKIRRELLQDNELGLEMFLAGVDWNV